MALRYIKTFNAPVLRKKSKKINKVTDKIKTLADDMVDTLHEADGVGLSAVQVGILKRLIVVDFSDSEGEYEKSFDWPIIAINPEITSAEGEICEVEGCLSFPNYSGKVKRPQKVKVKYETLDGQTKEEEYEDMVARCFCHEIDHLNGIVYLDKAEEDSVTLLSDEE